MTYFSFVTSISVSDDIDTGSYNQHQPSLPNHLVLSFLVTQSSPVRQGATGCYCPVFQVLGNVHKPLRLSSFMKHESFVIHPGSIYQQLIRLCC